jgi:hypothetical protein
VPLGGMKSLAPKSNPGAFAVHLLGPGVRGAVRRLELQEHLYPRDIRAPSASSVTPRAEEASGRSRTWSTPRAPSGGPSFGRQVPGKRSPNATGIRTTLSIQAKSLSSFTLIRSLPATS